MSRKITLALIVLLGLSTCTVIISKDNGTFIERERVVDYRYLDICEKCGYDLLEGYHSLVDGYWYTICNECGDYEEGWEEK